MSVKNIFERFLMERRMKPVFEKYIETQIGVLEPKNTRKEIKWYNNDELIFQYKKNGIYIYVNETLWENFQNMFNTDNRETSIIFREFLEKKLHIHPLVPQIGFPIGQ